MLVKRLIKNSSIELELQDKVTGCDIIVTVFKNVLKNVFEIAELTSDELENKLLEAENLDAACFFWSFLRLNPCLLNLVFRMFL